MSTVVFFTALYFEINQRNLNKNGINALVT